MANVPILTIRADALRASLSKISQHLKSVPDRRKDLIELDQQIEQMRRYLYPLLKKVRDAKTQFDFAVDWAKRNEVPRIGVADITEAETQVQSFIEDLRHLQGIVTRMRDKCFHIHDAPIG